MEPREETRTGPEDATSRSTEAAESSPWAPGPLHQPQSRPLCSQPNLRRRGRWLISDERSTRATCAVSSSGVFLPNPNARLNQSHPYCRSLYPHFEGYQKGGRELR